MTLRIKLLLAQLPLAAALVVVGCLSIRSTQYLGSSSQAILQDNYRSVIAAQRMKEALERIDSANVFLALGEKAQGDAQRTENIPRFESELRAQENNITEVGEPEATARLRQRWEQYQRQVTGFTGLSNLEEMHRRYFVELEPQFLRVKEAADEVLALNQDAMVRKSDQARRSAKQVDTLLIAATLLALALGGLASSATTTRLLRPLSVLTQAARRIGQGDLDTAARVEGQDEVAQLGTEFNEMARRLRQYRASSLGDLLQAQAASQAAIDSLPDPVVVFDAAGGVLAANQAADHDLHFGLEMGTPSLARVEPGLRATLEKVRGHVLGGKGAYAPRGFEEAVRLPGPEGDRFLLPRATPVYAAGGAVTGATVVLQDVTRLHRFDELKNDVVATVAHELRTPLTSLRMAIHLILEGAAGPVSDKQVELLEAGRHDCERLQSIVNELLDLSRLQAGKVELHLQPQAVARLLEGACEEVQTQATARSVKLTIEDQAPGASVSVDLDRLQLVFSNLLSNAIRSSPSNGVVVLRACPEGKALRFEVSDSGPGVPPEYRERIFEKYFRVPGGPGGGAGLGLSIAREIVTVHGGELGVESSPGQGATFWFTVPLS